MKPIHLQFGNTQASINPHGAWVTELRDEKGDIFYPRRELILGDNSMKLRGGCHVCVPNFGPGGESGMPQHGYGRVKDWQVVEVSSNHASLVLSGGDGIYKDVSTMLSIALDDHALVMTISVINKGNKPVRVAPAFHPYFAVSDIQNVFLDDDELKFEHLDGTSFSSGECHDIVMPGRSITIASKELHQWAVWTDMLDNYLCVEPTLSGYAFTRDQLAKDEMIDENNQKTYSMTLSWR